MSAYLKLKSINISHKSPLQFIKLHNIYFFSVLLELNVQNLSYFNSVLFIIFRVLRNFGLIKSINKDDFY